MRPRRTPDCNVVYHLEGHDLWALAVHVGEMPMIRSTWELSPDDRREIADGANIELTIFSAGQPPVMLATTRAELGAGHHPDDGPPR